MEKEKKSPVTVVADIFCRIEKEITWICFFIMLILMVIQVFCRYIFDWPLAWAEELIRYIYLGVSFTGASIAVRENSHICIDILPNIVDAASKHSQKAKKIILTISDTAANIVGALFWGYMLNVFIAYLQGVIASGKISVANQWPMWIIYLPVVVCSGLMVLHYVLNAIEVFAKLRPSTSESRANREGGAV